MEEACKSNRVTSVVSDISLQLLLSVEGAFYISIRRNCVTESKHLLVHASEAAIVNVSKPI